MKRLSYILIIIDFFQALPHSNQLNVALLQQIHISISAVDTIATYDTIKQVLISSAKHNRYFEDSKFSAVASNNGNNR